MSLNGSSFGFSYPWSTNQGSALNVPSIITAKAERLLVLSPVDEYSVIHASVAALSPFLDIRGEIVLAKCICSSSEIDKQINKSRLRTNVGGNVWRNISSANGARTNGVAQKSGFLDFSQTTRTPSTSAQSPLGLLSRIQELILYHRQEASIIPPPPPQYVPGGIRVSANDAMDRLSRIKVSENEPSNEGNPGVVLKTKDLLLLVLDAQIRSDGSETQRLQDVIDTIQDAHNAFTGAIIVLIDDEMYERTEFLWKQIEGNSNSWSSTSNAKVIPATNSKSSRKKILLVRAPRFGPPSQEYALTEAAIESGMGLQGLLPMICAGVATGALGTSPLSPFTSLKLVPVDMAIHIAFLCYHRLLHEEECKFSSPTVDSSLSSFLAVSIPTPAEHSIVWGKIEELIVNYYKSALNESSISSIFANKKREIFFSLTNRNPSLTFQPSLEEGIMMKRRQLTLLPFLEENRSRRRKEELRSLCNQSPIPINCSKMQSLLESLETVWDSEMDNKRMKKWKTKVTKEADSLATIFQVDHSLAPSPSKDFYLRIVARLGFHPSLIPYTFYTSLELVDWGMYILVLSRCVLGHLAKHFFSSDFQGDTTSSSFPLPMREVMNFHKIKSCRIPFLSRCRASASFYIRTGVVPSGKLYCLTRGMTPQRLSVILAQPDVQRMIASWSLQEGCSEEETIKRAKRILLRIGDTLNDAQSRSLGTAVYHTFSRMYDKVEVNYEAFERLTCWSRLPRVQVVLIPSHRSYIDFMIMSLLTASMEVPLPHIAAGEDFLQMGPLANFMRGTGAFFMRRSFRDDPLYSILFKEYVRQLVLHQQMIEFFIEGTRSRTGQTLQPKMGILKCIVDSFLDGQNKVKDVLFIPISVSYDRLIEAPIYAQELLGIPKPKETISNLIKGFSSLKQEYGSIRIHIANAISLYSVISACKNTFALSKQEKDSALSAFDESPFKKKLLLKGTTNTPPGLLKTLSRQIISTMMKNIVITSTSVVAAALETCWSLLRTKDSTLSSLPLGDVRTYTIYIIQWIQQRQGKLSDDFFSFSQEEILDIGLRHLSNAIVVDKASASINFIFPFEVSQMIVHMGTNQLAHLFIQEAVLTVVANGIGVMVEAKVGEPLRRVQYNEMLLTSRFLKDLFLEHFPSMSENLEQSCESIRNSPFANSSYITQHKEANEHEKWVLRYYNSYVVSQDSQSPAQVVVPKAFHAEQSGSNREDQAFFTFRPSSIYNFTSHLLFPHIDAIYVLLEGIVALLKEFTSSASPSSTPLQKRFVVRAVHKTIHELCSGGYLQSSVACSLDPLTHHLDSLLRMKLLRTSSSNPELGILSGIIPEDQESAESLSQFACKLHQLRLHPEKEISYLELKDLIERMVLRKYVELVHIAKL